MDGRTALITGGSQGLGRAMALKFAQAGANVAIAARRPDVLEETKAKIDAVSNGKVGAYACDVTDSDQIDAMIETVNSDFGGVDILVNNAGTAVRGKFEEVTDQTWQDDLDLKLFAAIRTCRLVLPKMKEQRWGRILNIINTAAKAPPAEGAPTAVSRAAGMALTKVLSKEYAPYNVLVNALCTGIIVTELWERAYQRQTPEMSFEKFIEAQGERVPMGRMGDPEEYANAACFLASDAGSYITGVALNIDGGMSPIV
jgi:NAD(P)-dependent dehydrogenase (short-subunit alcohol dehydrogenase family)